MRGDGGWRYIKAALPAERGITRDNGLSDPEPRHVVGDDFLSVRQGAGKLGPQAYQQVAKIRGCLSDVGIVIGEHGQSSAGETALAELCASFSSCPLSRLSCPAASAA